MPPVDLPTAPGDNCTGIAAAPSIGPVSGGYYKRGRWLSTDVEAPAPSPLEQHVTPSNVPSPGVAVVSPPKRILDISSQNSAAAAMRPDPSTITGLAAAPLIAAPARTAPPSTPAPAPTMTAAGADRGQAIRNSNQSSKNATVADREPKTPLCDPVPASGGVALVAAASGPSVVTDGYED